MACRVIRIMKFWFLFDNIEYKDEPSSEVLPKIVSIIRICPEAAGLIHPLSPLRRIRDESGRLRCASRLISNSLARATIGICRKGIARDDQRYDGIVNYDVAPCERRSWWTSLSISMASVSTINIKIWKFSQFLARKRNRIGPFSV